ncbi:MAG: DNA recombination/repair protein RecA, partial [Nitrospirota bacterium]|nr:DNA recombination/repair protein RecA [Nitrospirota bacterium]
KEGQEVVGSRVRVKVVKNKMAPPFKQAEFDILFAEGISKAGELVDLGVDKRVLDKSGAWYSYKGDRLGQGRDAVRDHLKANQSVAKEIEARIRDLAGMPGRTAEKRPDGRPEEKRADGRTDDRRPQAAGQDPKWRRA